MLKINPYFGKNGGLFTKVNVNFQNNLFFNFLLFSFNDLDDICVKNRFLHSYLNQALDIKKGIWRSLGLNYKGKTSKKMNFFDCYEIEN